MAGSFCTECGSPTELRVPEGDNRERAVCTNCGHIRYVNPNVVVGCIVEAGDQLLLCKRADIRAKPGQLRLFCLTHLLISIYACRYKIILRSHHKDRQAQTSNGHQQGYPAERASASWFLLIGAGAAVGLGCGCVFICLVI